MKIITIFLILILFCISLPAQITPLKSTDTICNHPVYRDASGRILAWYKPDIPGAGYDHVVRLASEFILTGTPVDVHTGLKLYLVTCCFQGPHLRSQEDFDAGKTGEEWAHNPACTYAGIVQGLVLGYRVYSGDERCMDVVHEMLDYQLQHGTTPGDWPWPNVPYASSDPFEREYHGATRWEEDGMRGDGLHGIEPDKVGELGIAYLKCYEVTGEEKYLEAAVHCADALAKNARMIPGDLRYFSPAETKRSPWPFRVNAQTGEVISDYCSNVIESVRLFDELIRISDRIGLGKEQVALYQKTRDQVWTWLFSKSGPMKTYVWNGYFEDVQNDPERLNRVQITPLETARYLIKNPGFDPDMRSSVPALINWVGSAFATEGMDAIKEQTWCYAPMGSHTARYASLCALWYEYSGIEVYKELASRFFNFASYMTYENGVVAVGPEWLGSWFSPAGENHLLRSVSVVRSIIYQPEKINFVTYDPESSEVLRLVCKPASVMVNNRKLDEQKISGQDGWTWEELASGGILRIKHTSGSNVSVSF